jgi:glutaminase
MAFRLLGDELWERVGREPSGTPFNSLVQLEAERGKPRNPFINAGALVVTDVLCRRFVKAETALVEFLRRLTGEATIDYDLRVAQSELRHADRNQAMAHFIASFGNMEMPVYAVVDAYCRQCAISTRRLFCVSEPLPEPANDVSSVISPRLTFPKRLPILSISWSQ